MPLYLYPGIFNMDDVTLIPRLFRTEYQKIVSVLSNLFGIKHIEIAEDIVSDTFLSATEVWTLRGVPENPTAWLYTVAKNKTRNYFKRSNTYEQKITPELAYRAQNQGYEIEVDLSEKNITDSQLAMIFAVCHPCNPHAAQIALALNLLCGFNVNEIADAYLTNREVIYKRINRAKEKLKEENIAITYPTEREVVDRLDSVLKTIYLLFSEGYYSTSQDVALRKDFCTEAMRLAYLLIQNESTNLPQVNALMALMCFHASRFDARTTESGELILYPDQDESLWNMELIERGGYFLNQSSSGQALSKYHVEAGIAYWHTKKEDTVQKWTHILALYDSLLLIEDSPIAALNRIYALSKVNGKQEAIHAASKLTPLGSHLYYALLGHLYTDVDNKKALAHFRTALDLAKTAGDKTVIMGNMRQLSAAL